MTTYGVRAVLTRPDEPGYDDMYRKVTRYIDKYLAQMVVDHGAGTITVSEDVDEQGRTVLVGSLDIDDDTPS